MTRQLGSCEETAILAIILMAHDKAGCVPTSCPGIWATFLCSMTVSHDSYVFRSRQLLAAACHCTNFLQARKASRTANGSELRKMLAARSMDIGGQPTQIESTLIAMLSKAETAIWRVQLM